MHAVLFATEEEAAPFRRIAPAGTRIEVCGMGAEAAERAVGRLAGEGVRTILNAGVCGALSGDIPRGAVFAVREVRSEESPDRPPLYPVVPHGVPLRRLVTVREPVFDPRRRERLVRLGDLVDMEGYGVAAACRRHGLDCILVKGVTDFGDDRGREELHRHLAAVSESVAETAARILDERKNPPLWKRLKSFTRIEHIVFSLPLLFAGAWLGAGGPPPPRLLLLIALAGIGARTFGMALNRIFDREIDALNPRTRGREIPAGRLSLLQAWLVAGAGAGLYFAACALMGPLVLRLSLLPLIPLAFYSLLKRFTSLCHYGIGVCLAAAPLGAYVAASGSLAFSPEIVLLSAFAFCWISGFDIIYALQDLDFDRRHGVHSLPAAIGGRKALLAAAFTHLAALACLFPLVDSRLSAAAFLAAAAAFAAAYLPFLPLPFRFFPLSAVAGIAGALVPLL